MFRHICQICRTEFESSSNRAKYCIYCHEKAQTMRNKTYKEKKQANARKQQPTAEYIKEKYDYIRFNVPKGEGDKIKAYAQEHGMTVKELMLVALEEYQKNHS